MVDILSRVLRVMIILCILPFSCLEDLMVLVMCFDQDW